MTAADTSPTEETGDSTGARETGATGAGGGVSGSEVDCTGNSCSVTLSGDGAEGEVLGTQIVLGGVENGEATFRVGDNDFSCGQGESGSVGPLTFECTSVTEEAVTLTATLG